MFGKAPGSSDDVICVRSLILSFGTSFWDIFHIGKRGFFHVKITFLVSKFRVQPWKMVFYVTVCFLSGNFASKLRFLVCGFRWSQRKQNRQAVWEFPVLTQSTCWFQWCNFVDTTQHWGEIRLWCRDLKLFWRLQWGRRPTVKRKPFLSAIGKQTRCRVDLPLQSLWCRRWFRTPSLKTMTKTSRLLQVRMFQRIVSRLLYPLRRRRNWLAKHLRSRPNVR